MVKKRQAIKKIIERYKEELKNLGINTKQVILYGSYAKGSHREESDIDLIVVSDDFKKSNLRERLEILGIAAGRVFEPIEALGYTSQEIKKQRKDSFVGSVLSSLFLTF